MTVNEIADEIERTRQYNKELWQQLAFLLDCDFKAERRHNDIIIRMLRLAGASTSAEVKGMLLEISMNDRTISNLVSKLAKANLDEISN